MRRIEIALAGLEGIAVLVLLGGCAGRPARPEPSGSPAPREAPAAPVAGTLPGAPASATPPPAGSAATRLTIAVRDRDGGPERTATLECAPGGGRARGFLRDASRACAAVEAGRGILVRLPPRDRACTMQYGGPQVARIAGTVRGEAVEVEVRRRNGCEIADWATLEALLGPPRE